LSPGARDRLELRQPDGVDSAPVTEPQLNQMRLAGFALAAAAALALQWWRPHAGIRWTRRGNLGLWGLNGLVVGAVCGGCACGVATWAQGAGIGLLNMTAAPQWCAFVATVVGLDGVSYLWHRANHRIRWLWRLHQVHHSDASFTVSTGVRFHPGEVLLSLPLRLAAVVALGAPPIAVVVFEIVFTTANLIEHGDIDLPLRFERQLARLCITPAAHRRHHSRARPALDCNFGTIFVCWDRLFGTYAPASSATAVATGLAGLDATPTFTRALLLPRRVYPLTAGRQE
jgi:sterol desaturase/sphingolipid hydroxylase (fatty acid hydroxylase superfamily)